MPSFLPPVLRRSLTSLAVAAALATPSAFANASTIHAVMSSALRVMDPIATTAQITRNHGFMIYDTLVGMDNEFQPRPQMADWTISDDGLTYTFRLRDGLEWHDGTPVTARDCVASLERWAQYDIGGQMMMDYVESLTAEDDRTLVLKLSRPFGYVLDLLAKPSSVAAFMMPERVAKTPYGQQISEFTGSGPFKFVADEFVPGSKVVYEKFEDYVPREEPADGTAGGKRVMVDRVEWLTMPDHQTAINALSSGDVDFIEQVPIDLLPLVENDDSLEVGVFNPLGYQTGGRMNFLYPPFDDVRIRRAALLALNQQDVLDALIGNPEYYRTCGAIFGCDTPLETDVGAESLLEGGRPDEARALLEEAGYDGTPVVILQATDVATQAPPPMVAASALRNVGFNVQLTPMDWQTLVSRRANQGAPDQGGWNMFFTYWNIQTVWNPVVNPMLNGSGREGAWFGWPTDPEMDQMRVEFAEATDETERREIATRIQAHAYDTVSYIPLGQYRDVSAWRKELSAPLEGPSPVFWGIEKND
ncbi:ABC transporter substrate-binding protein [Halotalea alkalilenta]|uniref:ABC transporter substrate-binding protein n=1 Tax=Halotalea alkalilenta TaxID=376489 RepID=UPI000488294D|nr:ABC transporter substrate-binding protein [Halotalea alkalilenta]